MNFQLEIREEFIEDILIDSFGDRYNEIYNNSHLIQYIDMKSKAIHGNVKTRRSLANLYAIYSIVYCYIEDGFYKNQSYANFDGFDYTRLLNICRSLYGGQKLQNHALNSRVNGEYQTKFETSDDLIYKNNGKYLIPIKFLYVNEHDISLVCKEIIEKYIQLLREKDINLFKILNNLLVPNNTYQNKLGFLLSLLTADSEARIFEILSYAILKNHYKNCTVYFGYTPDTVCGYRLDLYKTGRTNANDGGIDFVMRPIGRFFQVTEVGNYDKYLLDIDKVIHYPVTFVVKTMKYSSMIYSEFMEYISCKSGGMSVIENRYKQAVEEIITINELRYYLNNFSNNQIDDVVNDITIYYKLELNIFE